MGVDMATYKQLIAHRLNIAEICEEIGADSLDYLSLPGLVQAVEAEMQHKDGHCTACFSGQYPITIPHWLFEEERDSAVPMLFGQGIWPER